VLEIYQEDIPGPDPVGTDLDEDPMAKVARARRRYSRRSASQRHRYRWNRACYGVMDARPTCGSRNRVMPSGRASSTNGQRRLVFGVMAELGAHEEDVTRKIDFDQAGPTSTPPRARPRRPLHLARRQDLSAQQLVLDRLIPSPRPACAPADPRRGHQAVLT